MRVFALIAALACCGGPALAQPVCDLIKATDYNQASILLQGSRCSLIGEDGLRSRQFRCSGEFTSAHLFKEDASDGWGVLLLGQAVSASASRLADCGLELKPSDKNFDTPLFLGAWELGRDVIVTRVGVSEDVSMLWVRSGRYSRLLGYDQALSELLDGAFEARSVRFTPSEIRVAGEDIARARRGRLVQILEQRGAVATPVDLSAFDFIKRDRFRNVDGVPGLVSLTIESMNDRVLSVDYNIPVRSDYEAFVATLDARYGASDREMDEGCTRRVWVNGGGAIHGSYCPSDPSQTGFSFTNRGASDAALGAMELVARDRPAASKEPERSRPRVDMY